MFIQDAERRHGVSTSCLCAVLAPILLAITSGCGSAGSQDASEPALAGTPTQLAQADRPPFTSHPDPVTIERAEAARATQAYMFTTSLHIDGSSHGLIGDGLTDNTQVLRSLLLGGDRTIYIEPGEYVTSSIELEPNTRLVLEPGVTIRDAGRLLQGERLINIRSVNVHIVGWGAKVVADRADYASGEQRHGVFIQGASNVLIEGLESSSHGGDGFYIGGNREHLPSTDVMIVGCRADNNRRQGLSITSAQRVRIIDCEFMRTSGTAPQFGIDIEPNYSFNRLDDILIIRPYTAHNRGGDIMINLSKQDASSLPISISIIEHASASKTPTFYVDLGAAENPQVTYSAYQPGG